MASALLVLAPGLVYDAVKSVTPCFSGVLELVRYPKDLEVLTTTLTKRVEYVKNV